MSRPCRNAIRRGRFSISEASGLRQANDGSRSQQLSDFAGRKLSRISWISERRRAWRSSVSATCRPWRATPCPSCAPSISESPAHPQQATGGSRSHQRSAEHRRTPGGKFRFRTVKPQQPKWPAINKSSKQPTIRLQDLC